MEGVPLHGRGLAKNASYITIDRKHSNNGKAPKPVAIRAGVVQTRVFSAYKCTTHIHQPTNQLRCYLRAGVLWSS